MHADRVEGSAQIETGKEAGVSETIECLNDDEEGSGVSDGDGINSPCTDEVYGPLCQRTGCGTPQGEDNLQMNPLPSCLSNHNRSAFSFASKRLYMLAEAGRAVGDRRIVWLHGWMGGKKSDSHNSLLSVVLSLTKGTQ